MEPRDIDKKEESRLSKYGVPKYRKKVIEKLNEALKNDYLEFEDYEKRLELANKADSMEDLNDVLYDFPENRKGLGGKSSVSNQTTSAKDLSYDSFKKFTSKSDEVSQNSVNILSSCRIDGLELPYNELSSINILGSTTIDFSGENRTGKIFELKITNILGDTKIIVPSNYKIKSNIVSVLGDFRKKNIVEDVDAEPDKMLIVTGFSFMGDIKIQRPRKGFLKRIKIF